jgi:hypothetical protein
MKEMMKQVILILMTLVGMAALGQVPSGTIQYEFATNSGMPLWNFSGTYLAPYYLNTNDTLQLHQDGRGRIIGTYQSAYQMGGQTIDYVVGAEGSVRSAGTNISVRLASSIFLVESSVSYFDEIGVRRKDRLLFSFEPATRTLTGTDRVTNTRQRVVVDPSFFGSSHTKNLGSFSYTKAATLAVPEQSDGSWTLKLDLVPAGNKLSGTGTIIFSNGEIFEFQLTGSYSPAKQTSKVLLLGSGSAKGARLVLSMVEPEGRIVSMRGTVAGQKLLLR